MSQLTPIHPFPARMAPEIALAACESLPSGSTVLDPMSGSGTVLRVASERGLTAIGRDMDPLAVLIASVWSSDVKSDALIECGRTLQDEVRLLDANSLEIDWIDNDAETKAFVDFWFAENQQKDLRRFAYALHPKSGSDWDAARVALSRLIITKESKASLARDTSHSRPHRVKITNDFDVYDAYEGAVASVARALKSKDVLSSGSVLLGDARSLDVDDQSIDAVITSPPYLNAIDYMRGHKLSLVWLGYRLSDLRDIRRTTIGAERGLDDQDAARVLESRAAAYSWFEKLESRCQKMVLRYVADVDRMLAEIARVLKKQGSAVIVIGNSCLRGVYVENSQVVIDSATNAGLRLTSASSRALPDSRRYLPTPKRVLNEDLAKRMRHELVLTFAPA